MAFKLDQKRYDQMFFDRNSGVLEHILLMAVIKSYRFYAQVKTRLCPRLPDGRTFRPDFSRTDFNRVYAIVAQFWESVGFAMKQGDMTINADLMDLIFAKHIERGYLTAQEVQEIESTWLVNDIQTIEVSPDLLASLPGNPMFVQWLEGRATTYEQQRLSPLSLGRPPTLTDLQTSVKAVQSTVATPANQLVNAGSLVDSSMEFSSAFTTSLPRVDAMYGGGFRLRESTVVAAISGGGKTIMTMQLARDFVISSLDTIVLTTEQPPWQMLPRLISNHMSLDFSLFTTRVTAATENSKFSNVVLPFTPADCWKTHDRWNAMAELKAKLDRHLVFVDWSSGGFTLLKDFEAAIDAVTASRPEFDPKVIIVDWVGGGLDYSSGTEQNMRHFFKAAGEVIISHGKRFNRCMFMMAQLNKAIVRPHTRYVTMDMMAECKSLADNAANFMGITGLRDEKGDRTGRINFEQNICADKARMGPKGFEKVVAEFHYQRFRQPAPNIKAGDL